MNQDFHDEVRGLAQDGMKLMKKYLAGELGGSDKIAMACRMIQFGLKSEHMKQVKSISDRSLALRMMPYLPKGVDRDEYIRETNPQLKPLLLGKPAKWIKIRDELNPAERGRARQGEAGHGKARQTNLPKERQWDD